MSLSSQIENIKSSNSYYLNEDKIAKGKAEKINRLS